MTTSELFPRLFQRLDDWRHLPAYQLERRADIFFSMYLSDVLHAQTGAPHRDPIPEFPLKRRDSRKSSKVDYLVIAEGGERASLVELKTDMASLSSEQQTRMEIAASQGWVPLMEDLREILGGTPEPEKYCHLLRNLEGHGLLRLPDDLLRVVYGPHGVDRKRVVMQRFELTSLRPSLDVLHILPHAKAGYRCIDFATFAAAIDALHEDPLSRRFSESLRRWQGTAGRPSSIHGLLGG